MMSAGSDESLGCGPLRETKLAIFPKNVRVYSVGDGMQNSASREGIPKGGWWWFSVRREGRQLRAFFCKFVETGGDAGKVGSEGSHQVSIVVHSSGRPRWWRLTAKARGKKN